MRRSPGPIGSRRIWLAVVAVLICAATQVTAQPLSQPDDLLDRGYGLWVSVVVNVDGASGGHAEFVATREAVTAIADHFDVSRAEACRRIVYPDSESERPHFLNPRLWTERTSHQGVDQCRYTFGYPEGTDLSSFSITSTGRIRYSERFDSPNRSTLFESEQTAGTVWDEEVVELLISEYGLPRQGPLEVVRIRFPHRPDGPESRNAEYAVGNDLIWHYSPLGTIIVDSLEGSATPTTTAPTTTITPTTTTTIPTTTTTTTTTRPLSTTTTTTPVAEEPPPEPEPFPWLLLLLAMLGGFASGWIVGETTSKRKAERASEG